MNINSSKQPCGFTLAELAIVLVAVGLLLVSFVKGAEMIKSSRVNATISKVKQYQSALNSFRDTYAAIPGDMPVATQRISGCDQSVNCKDGDGDQIVGAIGWINQLQILDYSNGETSLFWKHLVLSNLITDVAPNTPLKTVILGETNPQSPFGGGFHVVSSSGTRTPLGNNVPPLPGGLHLIATNIIDTSLLSEQKKDGALVSPITASLLDKKMDDGSASSGNVWPTPFVPTGSASDVTCASMDLGYLSSANPVSKKKSCSLYFALGI
jgi:prepilin-type N-terminal cleavage/methylation domain-containing protein